MEWIWGRSQLATCGTATHQYITTSYAQYTAIFIWDICIIPTRKGSESTLVSAASYPCVLDPFAHQWHVVRSVAREVLALVPQGTLGCYWKLQGILRCQVATIRGEADLFTAAHPISPHICHWAPHIWWFWLSKEYPEPITSLMFIVKCTYHIFFFPQFWIQNMKFLQK